jgi:CRP-like cAMP-binding protein
MLESSSVLHASVAPIVRSAHFSLRDYALGHVFGSVAFQNVAVSSTAIVRRTNDILARIPDSEWALLESHASLVALGHAELLFTNEQPADLTYFPVTSIVSMIAEMANGEECEYGCIGREGMLGLQVALGAQPLRGSALCQLKGTAIRFDGRILRTVTSSGAAPELHRLLLRYAQGTINVLAQSAACNALHSIKQRTARWLLQTRDRAGKDQFSLTQEFLAKMLGVRRASVTEIALGLQDCGIIDYNRGHIHILDVAALESESCECYWVIRDEYALTHEIAQ